MLGVIKLILNGTWTRTGRTIVEGATIAVLTVRNNAPALARLIRWSSKRKGGEGKGEDGFDKLHCVRGKFEV